eukprot:gene6630-2570_t
MYALQADHIGPKCYQLFGLNVGASENCLTLSAWSPWPLPKDPLPVMVYFHGGDLTEGQANTDFAMLSAEGLVVFDVNYRLNVFGFLAADELAAADPRGTAGNYGLLDIIESLRWVQRNAAAFGGDARKVTVFGQSSGGTAVLALFASPAAHGLFSRGMSLSGSPNMTMSRAAQRAQHAHIVDALGCRKGTPADVVACLRAVPPHQLTAAVPKGGSHASGTG